MGREIAKVAVSVSAVVKQSEYEPWLRLLLVPELRKPQWFRLHQCLGSPQAILGSSCTRIAEIAGVNQETAQAILRGPDNERLEKEIELIQKTGADVYTFDDARYPESLRHCSAPPLLLYVQGEIRSDDQYAVVVVGSRTMTQYGKLACQNVVAGLVGAGVTVVSGMAHGIDWIAHDAALRHGGRTLAILAQGLAARESSHRVEMRQRIVQSGAVISEFPMTASPERYHFPTRNHTMAALGLATVVVEAGEKSGALITAEKALEENRQVFAVPGDVMRVTSRGTNGLIRNGAALARDANDVLADLQPQLRDLLERRKPEQSAPGEPVLAAALNQTTRSVLAHVGPEPIHFDLLYERLADTGMDFGALAAALLELEMKGLVRHLPGNLYMTERPL